MRVVCPYVRTATYDRPGINPLTEDALDVYAPHTEFVEMHGDHDYYNLLVRLWDDGESFLIVEHDIEIHERVIPDLATCRWGWCSFGYEGGGGNIWQTSLGCTRFTEKLIEETPTLMRDLGPRHWKELDGPIAAAMPEPVHSHLPLVKHHRVY